MLLKDDIRQICLTFGLSETLREIMLNVKSK